MKELFRNSVHNNSKSYECLVIRMNNRYMKFTYEAGNAYENCKTEFFDGHKWNTVFSMLDIGYEPDNFMYILSIDARKERLNMLFDKALDMSKAITVY